MNRYQRMNSADFGRFPTTQWTLVHKAGESLNVEQREALNEVLTQYWPALRAHLVSKKGIDPHEADDLVQGFLTDRVLESNLLATADRDRGRFRSLLARSLENYVANELRRRKTKKRQAERAVSLDAMESNAPNSAAVSPAKQAEADSARETLRIVLDRMREECRSGGRAVLWDVFQARIVSPILDGTAPVQYGEIVRCHGFGSTSQAQNTLATAKRMFIRTMRAVLRELGTNESDVDAEIRDLEQCLSVY